MVRKCLLICAVCLVQYGRSQFLDSLSEAVRHKYSIDARFESRYNFVDNRAIHTRGVRLGVAFQRKLRIGAGLSWLQSNVQVTVPNTETALHYLKFVYACFYADFVFHKTQRWQLSIPIQAGPGVTWLQTEQRLTWPNSYRKYFLLLYEPGITVQFKVFRWFGLGSDVGYRFALNTDHRAGTGLSSPTYCFRLLLWVDQIYYQVFPASKLSARYGPSYW